MLKGLTLTNADSVLPSSSPRTWTFIISNLSTSLLLVLLSKSTNPVIPHNFTWKCILGINILHYYATAKSTVQITREWSINILRYILYGYLDSWLFFAVDKTYLTGRLRAPRFSIRFAFPALWATSSKTKQKKSSWIINNLLLGWSKYGTARKNTQRYYTPKRLIRYRNVISHVNEIWHLII